MVGQGSFWQESRHQVESKSGIHADFASWPPTQDLAEFEECVDRLAIEQGKRIMASGLDSMLMHRMSDEGQEIIRILDTKRSVLTEHR